MERPHSPAILPEEIIQLLGLFDRIVEEYLGEATSVSEARVRLAFEHVPIRLGLLARPWARGLSRGRAVLVCERVWRWKNCGVRMVRQLMVPRTSPVDVGVQQL